MSKERKKQRVSMNKKKYTLMLFEIFALGLILMLFVLIETKKQNPTD